MADEDVDSSRICIWYVAPFCTIVTLLFSLALGYVLYQDHVQAAWSTGNCLILNCSLDYSSYSWERDTLRVWLTLQAPTSERTFLRSLVVGVDSAIFICSELTSIRCYSSSSDLSLSPMKKDESFVVMIALAFGLSWSFELVIMALILYAWFKPSLFSRLRSRSDPLILENL